MRHSTGRARLAIAVVAVGLIAGACSSSKSSSNADSGSGGGDKAAFCSIDKQLNSDLSNVTTADQFVAALKAESSKLDTYVADAPDEVKSAATTQVDAAKKTISTNDPSPMQATDVVNAGKKVDAFCGVSDSSDTGTSASS